MPRREVEGGWIKGWEDRKRPEPLEFVDSEGRTVFATTPITELEGRITPTDLYIVNQLGAPDVIHPDDWRLELTGCVKQSIRAVWTT